MVLGILYLSQTIWMFSNISCSVGMARNWSRISGLIIASTNLIWQWVGISEKRFLLVQQTIDSWLRAPWNNPFHPLEVSTSKDVKTQTHYLLRGEREAALIRFLQIPPEQISDPCHIILGKAEGVLELAIRNTKAVRTLSIPPCICLFYLMNMSEKLNTWAPFQCD